ALALEPKDEAALRIRGQARQARGNLDAANADFNARLGLMPESADAYVDLGLLQRELGDYGGALTILEWATRQAPRDVRAWRSLGLTLVNAGRYDDAVVDFTKAIDLEPARGELYYDRACAKYSRGEWDAAVEDYQAAAAKRPALADDARI